MARGTRMVLGFADYTAQARALAQALGADYGEIGVHRFPDGESRVTLPPFSAPELIFCRSLDRPNDKLVELTLAAATARQSGATRLSLVAPYLCYMRQDTAFAPREAVSQRIIGGWLAQTFDQVLTVDPHLHRVHRLEEVIPARQADWITAAGAIGQWLAETVDHPLLIGPDEESEQWVRVAAERHRLDYGIARKTRNGDRDVRVDLPDLEYRYRNVVLIDDIASTGRTLAETATAILSRGATRISAAITHGLFADDALAHLRRSGIEDIWTTDSIAHDTNVISLAEPLAEALREAPYRAASSA